MKHTPGPWKLVEVPCGKRGSPGQWLLMTELGRLLMCCPHGTVEQEATATLIAVAPELLEDAMKLVNEISGVMGAPEFRQLIGNTNFAVLKERWEQMRATITKAMKGDL